MSNLLFPLGFKRQYSGPLDADSVFENMEAMIAYIDSEESPKYDGQEFINKADKSIYILDLNTKSFKKAGELSEEYKNKLDLIKNDGTGESFLNDKGQYVKQKNSDWNSEDKTDSAYIQNKPNVYTQEEILAAFDYVLSQIAGTYTKKTDFLKINMHDHTNLGVLAGLSDSLDGSLLYNGKKLMTGISMKNKSIASTYTSEERGIALDVKTLLSSDKIDMFLSSEVVIEGDSFIEIYDGDIPLYSFTNTQTSRFDIGISTNIIIYSTGNCKIKYNYVSLG